MNFSPAQQNAIYTDGASLLVSAAAGSGKTAVLVERVIQKVLAGGDISRLWIMTFTEAAASEMRLKIEKAIGECLEKDPNNEHLQQQSFMLPTANISTIHSLCKRIIDQNFQLLGLEPSVGVGDDSQLKILFERLLEETIDELFEEGKTNDDIAQMLSFFSGGKNDKKLSETLRTAYGLYEEQPFPQTDFPIPSDIFDIFPKDLLLNSIRNKLKEALAQYEDILQDVRLQPMAQTKLYLALVEERDTVSRALTAAEKRDFEEIYQLLHPLKFVSWDLRAKVYAPCLDVFAEHKNRRAYAKDLVKFLQDNVFYKDLAAHREDMAISCKMLALLFGVVKRLDESFARLKRERGVISFADMEAMAMRLLVEDYDPCNNLLTPSEVALQLRSQIDEIIVDEYQDTNRRQDLIFRALTDDGKNIFMVGDVKQSIYRFRAAAPELFLEKKEHSVLADSRKLDKPSYMYLNQNFRSHPAILDFANQIFRASMSKRLGQIEYDESEWLNTGGLYPPESEGAIELALMQSSQDSSEEFEDLSGIEQQADYVAQKIADLHGTSFYDVKRKCYRPLQYGDMAILCRVAKNTAAHFEKALRQRGINCINNNQDTQFLDMWEIKMLRAYLQVISNPYRDIPLVTLLYSDFYNFSSEQLAMIRTEDKNVSFYDALKKRAQKDDACASFLAEVEALRLAAVGKRTDEVLQMIFARTHILERVASHPDGKSRVANMQLMLRYAAEYERDSYKGLFSFLNYLDKMSALQKILPGAKSGEKAEDCVQILSVHKSKGLEYPVCFLVGLEKGMRDKDSSKAIIFNHEFGSAIKMRRDEDFVEYPSLAFSLLKENNAREALSEEMRILYVALTRPKARLYLVCAIDDTKTANLLEQIAGYQGTCPGEFLATSASTLKWLLFALRDQKSLQPLYDRYHLPFTPSREDCRFDLVFCDELAEKTTQRKHEIKIAPDLSQAIQLAKEKYRYDEQTRLPIKLSVSEVKGMRARDPEAMELIEQSFTRQRPQFLSGSVGGNTVGNAVHKFMQFADFRALAEEGGFVREKERLQAREFLSEKEIALVDEDAVARFVAQPIFREMITSNELAKEKRFFFTLPAESILENCEENDPILLQGVLDCYYEKDGKIIVVDYKTDRLADEAKFVDRYGLQLELYRYGVEQITGKTVDKLFIYSFHLDKVIEIS